jgi:hypothetical protein
VKSKIIAATQKCQRKEASDETWAGHLFEELGTLEEAARHAASWFEQYL